MCTVMNSSVRTMLKQIAVRGNDTRAMCAQPKKCRIPIESKPIWMRLSTPIPTLVYAIALPYSLILNTCNPTPHAFRPSQALPIIDCPHPSAAKALSNSSSSSNKSPDSTMLNRYTFPIPKQTISYSPPSQVLYTALHLHLGIILSASSSVKTISSTGSGRCSRSSSTYSFAAYEGRKSSKRLRHSQPHRLLQVPSVCFESAGNTGCMKTAGPQFH